MNCVCFRDGIFYGTCDACTERWTVVAYGDAPAPPPRDRPTLPPCESLLLPREERCCNCGRAYQGVASTDRRWRTTLRCFGSAYTCPPCFSEMVSRYRALFGSPQTNESHQ